MFQLSVSRSQQKQLATSSLLLTAHAALLTRAWTRSSCLAMSQAAAGAPEAARARLQVTRADHFHPFPCLHPSPPPGARAPIHPPQSIISKFTSLPCPPPPRVPIEPTRATSPLSV
jgi:hypothetical protein